MGSLSEVATLPEHSEPHPNKRPPARWVTIWSRHPLIKLTCEIRSERPPGSTPRPSARCWSMAPSCPGLQMWFERRRAVLGGASPRCPRASGRVEGARGALSRRGALRGRRSEHESRWKALLRNCTREGTSRRRASKPGLACVTHTEQMPSGKLVEPHIDHICLPHSWAERAQVVDAWPGTIDWERLSDHSAIVVEVRASSGRV